MKKLVLSFLFLAALSIQACNNSSGNPEKNLSEGAVIKITTEEFQKLVWDYKKNSKEWIFAGDQPVIIDFYADWCRPCKMIAPVLEELALEYKGKIRIYKVNTDEQRELAALFNISSIPAVLYVPKTGKPQMAVGAQQKANYVEMINSVLMVK